MIKNGKRYYQNNRLGRGSGPAVNGRMRPPFLHPRKGTTLINAGTATTGWTNQSNATVSAASIVDKRGMTITALKALSGGANLTVAVNYATFPVPATLAQQDSITFDMYVDFQTWSSLTSASTGGTAAFYLLDAGEGNFFQWSVEVTMGWNRIVLHQNNTTSTSGTPVWGTTTFTKFRPRLNARAGYVGTFYISNLSFTGQTLKRAALCPMFDDGVETVYTVAYPLMAARGLVGSVGLISDKIGTAGYMTITQIRVLVAAGWSVFIHSKTHGAAPFLIGASQATCETEIGGCETALLALGLNPNKFYASPYGEWDTNYFLALAAKGMKLNRGLISATGYKTNAMADHFTQGALVPCVQIVNGTSAATALVWNDAAITTKSLQLFLLHGVDTVGSGTPPVLATSVATTLFDGWKTRRDAGTLDVMNLDQICELGGLKYAAVGYP